MVVQPPAAEIPGALQEGGHFLCLRSIGLPAEEFAIGFGPEVINFGRKDGTEFVVRALPIGGYVRFQDEKTVKLEDGSMVTEFDARSAPERLWVLAGGVLANVAVAWSSLVLGVLNFGVPTRDPLPGIRIEAVDEAAFTRTGLKAKDVLLKIGSMDLNFVGADVRSTVDYISKLPQGRAVEMVVDRAGEQLQLNGTTVTDPSTGLQRLGVMIDANSVLWVYTSVLTGVGSAEILGPVGIVQQGEELVQSEGLLGIFIFFVTINLNLAFINALPLPALDGGKALFVFAEQVLGRRLDEGKKQDIESFGYQMMRSWLLSCLCSWVLPAWGDGETQIPWELAEVPLGTQVPQVPPVPQVGSLPLAPPVAEVPQVAPLMAMGPVAQPNPEMVMAVPEDTQCPQWDQTWDQKWDQTWEGWDAFQAPMSMGSPAPMSGFPPFPPATAVSSSTMCKFFAQNRCLKGDLCPFQHGPPLELPSFTGTELPAAFRAILAQAPQQPGGPPPAASLPTLPRTQIPQVPPPAMPTAVPEVTEMHTAAVTTWAAMPLPPAPAAPSPPAAPAAPAAPALPAAQLLMKIPKLCKLYDMGGCTKGADCTQCHGQEDCDKDLPNWKQCKKHKGFPQVKQLPLQWCRHRCQRDMSRHNPAELCWSAFGLQLQKLQQSWDEAENRVQQLSSQLRSSEEGRQQQKQLKKSEEECQKLTAKLEKETAKVEEMKQNMEQVIKDAKERDEARMREIKQLREKKELEMQNLREKSDSSSKDAEALRQRLLGEATSELQELRSESAQQKEVLSAMLRKSSTEVAELRQSLEASKSQSTEEVQTLNEHLAEVQNSQGRLRSELRAQQDRSRRAERDLEQAHAECKELLSSADQRDSRVEVAQALLESRVQSLQEQLESLKVELEAAHAAEEARRCQAEAAEARCEDLQQAAKASEEERSLEREAFRSQLHTLKEELNSAHCSESSAEAELRAALQATQRSATEAEMQAKQMAAELASCREEVQQASLRANAAEERFAKSEAEAAQWKEVEKSLKDEVLEARSTCESHKQLIRALQQSMAEQKQQADSEAEDLRRQLSETTPLRTVSAGSRKLTCDSFKLSQASVQEEEQEEEEEEEAEAPAAEEEAPVAQVQPDKTEVTADVLGHLSDTLLDHLESAADPGSARRPSKGSAPPEAAGHEEVAQLWDRINYLEKRCRTLQKKLDARPIIYQAPTGYGPLNLEAGNEVAGGSATWEPWLREVTGPVARRLHLPQGSEQRVASVAAPLCQAIEVPLRNFTQRLLRRDRWLYIFYVHLLVLYAIAASCIARSSNPVSPAECVDTRLHQLAAVPAREHLTELFRSADADDDDDDDDGGDDDDDDDQVSTEPLWKTNGNLGIRPEVRLSQSPELAWLK
eukprot:s244_g35.t1